MKPKLGAELIAAWYALGGIVMALIALGIGTIGETVGLPKEIMAIGAVFAGAFALIAFAIAYGIYTLESWGWYAAIILGIISIAGSITSGNLFGILIPAIIIWYLWTNQRDFHVSIDL